jgi:hypothetical protein
MDPRGADLEAFFAALRGARLHVVDVVEVSADSHITYSYLA